MPACVVMIMALTITAGLTLRSDMPTSDSSGIRVCAMYAWIHKLMNLNRIRISTNRMTSRAASTQNSSFESPCCASIANITRLRWLVSLRRSCGLVGVGHDDTVAQHFDDPDRAVGVQQL